MTSEELRKLLDLGEGGELELKKSYSKDIFGQIICSFLNAKGGYLVLTPGNKKAMPDLAKEISAWIQQEIVPHTPIFVNVSRKKPAPALVIEVPEGLNKPYSFRNVFYLRDGGASRPAEVQEIRSMLLAQQVAPTRWERMFSDEITTEDFDHDEITALRKVVPFGDEEELMQKLEGLSLMRQGRLTNAADILLTKNPEIRHPQTRVRAACFVNKTDDQYQDYKIFEGPALQILEEILHFIERNTASRAVFTEGKAQREMRSQYPMKAVREGLVNAFVHRDYASCSGGIRVEIGRETLSIWNSGKLPEGVSLQTLKEGHVSVLRNPDIANYFHIRKYMEMLGRGSILIQRECREAGNKEPQWDSAEAGVTLTFFALGPMSGPMSETESDQGNEQKRPESGSESGPMSGPMLKKLQIDVLKAEEENSKIEGILKVLTIEPMNQSEMANALSLNSVSGALKRAVKVLEAELHLIAKTSDKARSRKQKYHLTDLGRQYLRSMEQ